MTDNTKTSKLANLFDRWREVIESAETPFSKLAIFILPILAPVVPAILTGMHVYQLLLQIFEFSYAPHLSGILSFIVGIVLEMLGYVGAISFIQNVFNWIRTRKEEFLVPSVLTFLSYLFYLIAMYQINVQLGKFFNTPVIMNSIVGLLAFITVPSSLLAATHLGQKELLERERETRKDNNDFRLKKQALKQGMNIFGAPVSNELVVDGVSTQVKHSAAQYKELVFSILDETLGQISLSDITKEINKRKRLRLEHKDIKGTLFKYKNQWKRERGFPE